MHATQQPTPLHFVLQVVHALPSILAAGAVCHPQEDPGDDLGHEGTHEHAARNINPAGSAGDVLEQRFIKRLFVPGPVIQPIAERVRHIGQQLFHKMPVEKFSVVLKGGMRSYLQGARLANSRTVTAGGYALGTFSCLPV